MSRQNHKLLIISLKKFKHALSESYGLSYSTVKRVWQSYTRNGLAGLSPKYNNCGSERPHHYRIYRMSIMLKRKYPEWGAPYILTILRNGAVP